MGDFSVPVTGDSSVRSRQLNIEQAKRLQLMRRGLCLALEAGRMLPFPDTADVGTERCQPTEQAVEVPHGQAVCRTLAGFLGRGLNL